MSTFPARYRGRCPSCEEPIEPGDMTTYFGHTLVHADCHGMGPEPDVEVCEQCNLTPCWCGA